MNVRAGHFIQEDMAAFDARFFSISPTEAMSMDPMQRMLLEVVYEATENAGIPLSKLAGTNTGCYVGCFSNDYDQIAKKDAETLPKYHSVGTGQSILSNRISFCFNLQGPSLTVDTACSSSLVALHMACQGLQSGETKAAIVGATQATLFPDMMVGMTNMHFLSPDGICYSFDSRANGYARGEGMAALVLKPLADAIQDGDTIRAVIRGTAVNSNGKNTGITLPMRDAQARLIRTAYKQAGCDLRSTGYIEAHGTGTPAGDPIEANAIGETLGSARAEGDGELYVGSVKSNIGHLEGASGLAGMIKTILSLEKGVIAPNVWFEEGNKDIDFDKLRLRIPTEPTPWPKAGLRRASVNSFGYGGTNGHVILDDAYHYMTQRGLKGKHKTVILSENEPPASGSATSGSQSDELEFISVDTSSIGTPDIGIESNSLRPLASITERPRVFHLAGHEPASVFGNAKLLSKYLSSKAEVAESVLLDDLAYTLCERRSTLDVGGHVVASTKEELMKELETLDQALSRRKSAPSIGFIFTGQGAQWWAMGRELLQYPVFEQAIVACDASTRSFGSSWSLYEELLKDQRTSRINEAEISQPLCTALQIALVTLFASWNILPDRVVGHSSGEIAAAYATGALNLDSAMRIAYFRGLLSTQIAERGFKGGMLAAGTSADEAAAKIRDLGDSFGKISVACVNSPKSVTLSGDTGAIDEMLKILTEEKIFARKLQVQTAYHSHQMQHIAEEYLKTLESVQVAPWDQRKNVTMFSSVKGRAIDANDDLGGAYWVQNMVSTVLFSDALKELCLDQSSQPSDVLVELGPHSALAGPVKQIMAELPKRDIAISYLSAIVRERTNPKGAAVTSLKVAASLYGLGYPTDLRAANFPHGTSTTNLATLTDLPTYSWDHSRKYWSESRLSKNYRQRPFPRTDLLGAPVNDWNPFQPRWRNFLRLSEQPWIAGHTIQGATAYPAAGFCCMALEAAAQLHAMSESDKLIHDFKLRDVEISRALLVPDTEEGVEVSFSMSPQSAGDLSSPSEFRIFSYTESSGWSEHCRGLVQVIYDNEESQVSDAGELAYQRAIASCANIMSAEKIYENFKSVGLGYGPDFQGIKSVSGGENQATGVVQVTDTASAMPKGFAFDRLMHPATMDALLQMSFVALVSGDVNQITKPYVPTRIDEITVPADVKTPAGQDLEVFCTSKPHGFREFHSNVTALTGGNKPAMQISGLKLVALASEPADDESAEAKKITATALWRPDVDLVEGAKMDSMLQASVLDPYDYEKLRDRELLGYYYIDQVLKSIDEDSEYSGMQPHHQKFFRYMQHQRSMVLSHTHEFQTDDWLDLTAPHVIDKIESIKANLAASDAEGEMFLRMGPALTSVLRQEVDPLALMMQDELLFDYYHCAPGSQGTYPKVGKYVELLSHKYPDLEYLEIGAGTGGLTKPILKALGSGGNRKYPRCKTYTYTDISTGFFEQAAKKFEESKDVLDFKKLDIEQEPLSQAGFDNGQLYDVIIASNVLHATRDMQRTMNNARKLLRPGGKLILLEVTHATIGLSLVFGNLAGWWASEETWRVNGPLLSQTQWESVCQECGFSKFEICSPDTTDPLLHQADVMVATAVPEKAAVDKPTVAKTRAVVLMPSEQVENAEAIVSALQENSDLTLTTCTLEEAHKIDLTGVPVVSLVEIDVPVLANISADDLITVQRLVKESAGFIWVTRGGIAHEASLPEMAVAQGLLRSIRHENEHLPVVSLDLSKENALLPQQAATQLLKVFEQHFGTLPVPQLGKADEELVEHQGAIHIKRAIENPTLDNLIAAKAHNLSSAEQSEDPTVSGRALKLKAESVGSLSSAVFEEDQIIFTQLLGETEVEIRVESIGMSQRDALICAGEIVDDHLGNQCAGTVTHVGNGVKNVQIGDRVVTWCLGAYATVVRNVDLLVQKIPSGMSFAMAASIPNAYIPAYYGLTRVANIQPEDSILIQNAGSAIGLAAIQVANTVGCEVYATVKDQNQKDTVQAQGISSSRIFAESDAAPVDSIRSATNGQGVTVLFGAETNDSKALKSLSGVIAPFGRVVALSDGELEPISIRNVTFTAVDTLDILRANTALAAKLFTDVMSLVSAGRLQPSLPLQVEPLSGISDIMRSQKGSSKAQDVVTVFEPRAGDLVQVRSKRVLSGD